MLAKSFACKLVLSLLQSMNRQQAGTHPEQSEYQSEATKSNQSRFNGIIKYGNMEIPLTVLCGSQRFTPLYRALCKDVLTHSFIKAVQYGQFTNWHICGRILTKSEEPRGEHSQQDQCSVTSNIAIIIMTTIIILHAPPPHYM